MVKGKFGKTSKGLKILWKWLYINSNMQNSMMLFTFSVIDWKYRFWANFVQNLKIVSSIWKLDASLIRYAWFNDSVKFFLFWSDMSFLGKFAQKCQNCYFKVKLTPRLIQMQNSMMLFSFFVFDQKFFFLPNLIQKVKVITLSWTLAESIAQICRTQWCCSLFPFLPINTRFE